MSAWVVKLGGSLARSPHLRCWLDALADSGRAVIVPGGGVFADAVRAAQISQPFDDESAHAMALLAMQQYGLMLRGLCPRLALEFDLERLPQYRAQGESVVWMPDLAQLNADGVPASWAVTSDSLAAWLAGRLGVSDLLMIKSVPVAPQCSLAELQAEGVIDAAFIGYVQASGCRLHWLSAEDSGRLVFG